MSKVDLERSLSLFLPELVLPCARVTSMNSFDASLLSAVVAVQQQADDDPGDGLLGAAQSHRHHGGRQPARLRSRQVRHFFLQAAARRAQETRIRATEIDLRTRVVPSQDSGSIRSARVTR